MSAAGGTLDGATPHRRGDGELVGWILPDGERWRALDLLGREVVADAEWLDAEDAIERRGLAYLADPWVLEREGAVPLRVRLLEVTPERIVVKAEDFGDVSRPTERVTLPWPLPAALRAPRPDDPDAYAL
ncbi:hypothetical protein [Microbacterium sp. bgisy203]|uniref:hypothetical protein n=1 Tax=Microbacterium sp. bgisy203 TaxID=3413799 RepID=UPI003D742928